MAWGASARASSFEARGIEHQQEGAVLVDVEHDGEQHAVVFGVAEGEGTNTGSPG